METKLETKLEGTMVDGRGADTTIPYTAGEGYTKALALIVVDMSFLRFLERATANKSLQSIRQQG